jgi:hypothetical protein
MPHSGSLSASKYIAPSAGLTYLASFQIAVKGATVSLEYVP